MSYTYQITPSTPIRDFYNLQVFLYSNGFQNIISINSDTATGILTIVNSVSLTSDQLITLNTLITVTYTNPYPSTNNDNLISLYNSSTSTLGEFQVFTGLFENPPTKYRL